VSVEGGCTTTCRTGDWRLTVSGARAVFNYLRHWRMQCSPTFTLIDGFTRCTDRSCKFRIDMNQDIRALRKPLLLQHRSRTLLCRTTCGFTLGLCLQLSLLLRSLLGLFLGLFGVQWEVGGGSSCTSVRTNSLRWGTFERRR